MVNGPTFTGDFDSPFGVRFRLLNSTLPTLKSGEKYTVSVPFIYHLPSLVDRFKGDAEYADIAIIVRFTVSPLQLNIECSFRFKTAKDVNGNTIWQRQPNGSKKFFCN